jgi:hypothetical protein
LAMACPDVIAPECYTLDASMIARPGSASAHATHRAIPTTSKERGRRLPAAARRNQLSDRSAGIGAGR